MKNALFKPQTLSEISRDMAQVFFAGMFVGAIVSNLDSEIMVVGLILSLVFWISCILLAKEQI